MDRDEDIAAEATVFKFTADVQYPTGHFVPVTVAELAAVRPQGAKCLFFFVDADSEEAAFVYPYRSF